MLDIKLHLCCINNNVSCEDINNNIPPHPPVKSFGAKEEERELKEDRESRKEASENEAAGSKSYGSYGESLFTALTANQNTLSFCRETNWLKRVAMDETLQNSSVPLFCFSCTFLRNKIDVQCERFLKFSQMM